MGETREIPVKVVESKRHSLLVNLFIRLLKEKPLGTIGGAIVLILILVGICADFIAPYGESEQILQDRLNPMSSEHLLGTDQLGRDLLSRIIYGARISLSVGLGSAFIGLAMSVLIGLTSGYFGGKFDMILQRFVDSFMSVPGLLIMLIVMSILGPGIIQVIIVLGFFSGIQNSRVVRSAVITIKENVYVDASVAVGCSTLRIMTRHIFPHVMAPIIILFTINMGQNILAEATISFLGYGIPPPAPSWGGMLSGAGRKYMYMAPWMALWPGLALAIVSYGINMFGDALRDLLDPRLRGGIGRYGTVKVKKQIGKTGAAR